MRTRRPRAPDWTDRNESDPGITLVELFGFLGETLFYSERPERHRRRLALAALILLALWKLRSDRGE